MKEFLTTPKDREAMFQLVQELDALLGDRNVGMLVLYLFGDGSWRMLLCYRGAHVAMLVERRARFTVVHNSSTPLDWMPHIEQQVEVLNRHLQTKQL